MWTQDVIDMEWEGATGPLPLHINHILDLHANPDLYFVAYIV